MNTENKCTKFRLKLFVGHALIFLSPLAVFANSGDDLMNELSGGGRGSKSSSSSELVAVSSGSGFFISENGYIVTNHHVVDGCDAVGFRDSENGVSSAEIIASDPSLDLAVLKANNTYVSYLTIYPSEPDLAADVYVAGFPWGDDLGTSLKVTKGVVSSLRGLDDNESRMQIDAALQKGNSGGPVVLADGSVTGVAVAKVKEEYGMEEHGELPQNINFAVKSRALSQYLKSLAVRYYSSNAKQKDNRKLGDLLSKSTLFLSCFVLSERIEVHRRQHDVFDRYK